jgi:hypothetical protein
MSNPSSVKIDFVKKLVLGLAGTVFAVWVVAGSCMFQRSRLKPNNSRHCRNLKSLRSSSPNWTTCLLVADAAAQAFSGTPECSERHA